MRGVLACIDANRVSDCNSRLPGRGLLLMLLSPHRKPLGAGARPVHPILGHVVLLRISAALFNGVARGSTTD